MNNFLLFETKYFQCFLNEDDQFYIGRSVILLKRNARTLSDLTPPEWQDLGDAIEIYERALKKAFPVINFNWSCTLNSAYQNSPPNPQVYWHVRPRYKTIIDFGDREYRDYHFGFHYQTRSKLKLSDTQLAAIANQIIASI